MQMPATPYSGKVVSATTLQLPGGFTYITSPLKDYTKTRKWALINIIKKTTFSYFVYIKFLCAVVYGVWLSGMTLLDHIHVQSGVFTDVTTCSADARKADHAVVVTGWYVHMCLLRIWIVSPNLVYFWFYIIFYRGQTGTQQYWIARNSWTTQVDIAKNGDICCCF